MWGPEFNFEHTEERREDCGRVTEYLSGVFKARAGLDVYHKGPAIVAGC